MSTNIERIDAEGNVDITQTSALFAKYIFEGQPKDKLKLTQKTNLLPPPLPIKLSKRPLLVKDYLSKMSDITLLHVKGEVGTGKTQLCNLLVSNIDNNVFWFRMREYKEQIKVLLTEIKNIITTQKSIVSLRFFSKKLEIPSLSTIVLDDLPNLNEIDVFDEFIQLLDICEKYKIKIISSSNYDLPSKIYQYSKAITSVRIPDFSDDETVELIRSYKAPKDIEKIASLINIYSDKHPSLIIATINYIESNNWKLDFETFLKNKFVDNELENFKLIFNKTVEDSQARELIYRLNNVGRVVTDEDIRLLSSIKPIIEHPFEKLSLLLNNWVFKESDKEYLLSPLIYKLGSGNLESNVEQKINLMLGTKIFKKQSVTPFEASRGINYLIKAKDYNTAGFRLFQILHSIADNSELTLDDILYLHLYWTDADFPVEMESNIQFLLRTMQIIIYSKFGQNTDKLYKSYLELESKIDKSVPMILLMSYTLFSLYKFKGFTYALKLSEIMNDLSPEMKEEYGLHKKIEGLFIDELYILNLEAITSLQNLEQWFSLIEKTKVDKLKTIFQSDIGIESVPVIQQLINKNVIRKENNKIIEKLYASLVKLAGYALDNSIMNLWVVLTTSAIDCLIKMEKYDEANAKLLDAFSHTKNDDHKLVINNKLAMAYIDKKEYVKALKLYEEVIDIKNTTYDTILIDARTYASLAYSLTGDYEIAKDYLEKAKTHYISLDDYDELFYLKLCGEYSIILWHCGLYYECILECENILIELEKNIVNMEESWKALHVILRHNLTYFVSMLTTGTPPKNFDNEEEYIVPYSGLFLYTDNTIHTHYDDKKTFLLYFQLYDVFYLLNDSSKGKQYLEKSFELSKESTIEDIKILLYIDIYLINGEYRNYFNVIKSFFTKSNEEALVSYIQLSLLKLVNKSINCKQEIENYKIIFIDVFSEVLEKKYFDLIIYILTKLIGNDISIMTESDNWLIQRLFALSELYESTINKAMEIHEVFYNDYFTTDHFKVSNAIKYEVLEEYFFQYWIMNIKNKSNSFLYSSALLSNIDKIKQEKKSPEDKVNELLSLIKRHKKT